MDDVDIGLFDRDWNNAIYFFMLNADEQIYMRYGGRDSAVRRHVPRTWTAWNWRCKQGSSCTSNIRRANCKRTERPKPLLPARDSPAGGAHVRAAAVRRVPPHRRFPERPARAGRHARQADAPLPLARYQDHRHLPRRAEGPRGEGGRRTPCRPRDEAGRPHHSLERRRRLDLRRSAVSLRQSEPPRHRS